jgi:hypothetical protein
MDIKVSQTAVIRPVPSLLYLEVLLFYGRLLYFLVKEGGLTGDAMKGGRCDFVLYFCSLANNLLGHAH